MLSAPWFRVLTMTRLLKKKTQEVNGVQYAVYPATKEGKFIGAAVEATSMGFGGELKVLVGFDAEGKIIDYSLLSHVETPGLGSKLPTGSRRETREILQV